MRKIKFCWFLQQDGYYCIVQWSALEKYGLHEFLRSRKAAALLRAVKIFCCFNCFHLWCFTYSQQVLLLFSKATIDISFGKYQTDITSKRLGDLSSAYGENYKTFIENVP